MLVFRVTCTAKQGSSDKLFDLLVEMHQQYDWPQPARVYKSKIGLQNQVIVEAECESLAEWEAASKQWNSQVKEDHIKALTDLIEPGGTTEFLTVTTIPNE